MSTISATTDILEPNCSPLVCDAADISGRPISKASTRASAHQPLVFRVFLGFVGTQAFLVTALLILNYFEALG